MSGALFDWSEAQCFGLHDWFFPERPTLKALTKARTVCQTCPLLLDCREYGRTYASDGFWGGVDVSHNASIHSGLPWFRTARPTPCSCCERTMQVGDPHRVDGKGRQLCSDCSS